MRLFFNVVQLGLAACFLCSPAQAQFEILGADGSTLRSTHEGDVIGLRATPGSDVWYNLPYAKPPVGELRWRAPQPPAPWQGIRYGLGMSPPCSQSSVDPAAFSSGDTPVRSVGQEDCLYLSVWSPHFGSQELSKMDKSMPVMVWIHGGGSEAGSGAVFNGAGLAATQKVIVVMVNYRLNPLGWFTHRALRDKDSSPDDRSGNFGTLDQIRALEWVRDNISAFGGNPDNVTIFGHSGGAWSVRALMVSPRAQGLFQRAIVESSAGVQRFSPMHAENFVDDEVQGHPLSSNELLVSLLLMDRNALNAKFARTKLRRMSNKAIAAYLRGKSHEELLRALGQTKVRNAGIVSSEAQTPWTNNSAPKFYDDGRVIDSHRAVKVPVMIGTTRYEDRFFLAFDPKYVSQDASGTHIRDKRRWELMSEYLGKLYKLQAVDSAAPQFKKSGVPVYGYRFDWEDLIAPVGDDDFVELNGAAHGAELAFVFGSPQLFWPGADEGLAYDGRSGSSYRELSNAMMSYWAQFARTGDPGRGQTGTLPSWEEWGDGQFMVFDSAIRGGIRLSRDSLTKDTVIAQMNADSRLADHELKCRFIGDLRAHFLNRLAKDDFKKLGSDSCPSEQ